MQILLDCRWLPFSGAGRITELLLRGLADVSRPGQWVLWGPSRVQALAWPGSEVRASSTDPRAIWGQRGLFEIPRSQLTVFMHQNRPLRRVPSVTFVYDTTVLRHPRNELDLRIKTRFLRRVAESSLGVVTLSEYSRDCICRDLDVPVDRVAVAPVPFDDAFAARVMGLRCRLSSENTLLYVGRFAPNKNLPRLLAAFERSRFRRAGGRLLLVGGTIEDLRAIGCRMGDLGASDLEARPNCNQQQLERLFATSLLLVQPSLEEGFGLPAWEALSSGLTTSISTGGALPEISAGLLEPFDPQSVEAITKAIDDGVERARSSDRDGEALRISDQLRQRAPTVAGFARCVQELVVRFASGGSASHDPLVLEGT